MSLMLCLSLYKTHKTYSTAHLLKRTDFPFISAFVKSAWQRGSYVCELDLLFIDLYTVLLNCHNNDYCSWHIINGKWGFKTKREKGRRSYCWIVMWKQDPFTHSTYDNRQLEKVNEWKWRSNSTLIKRGTGSRKKISKRSKAESQ
jgi:hypothetical protein